MKGIELSEKYYYEFGEKVLREEFSSVFDRLTIGVAGEGSDALGFDDEVSVDHDFGPGFCVFISREDEKDFGFKLERAYAKLPKEFMGFKREILSPVGGNRRGVIIAEDFYTKFLGGATAPNDYKKWLYLPSHALLSACNGKIFKTGNAAFDEVRAIIKKGYPEDVRKKKIAAHTVFMAQAGQYNFGRCIDRKETGAAQLCIFEFVKHAISVIYLLNNVYEPFYKWAYKGLRDLPILSDLELSLAGMTELGNSNKEASEKREIIEDVARAIIGEYKNQNLTTATCNNLETHAYSINDKILSADLRNMHIMEGG